MSDRPPTDEQAEDNPREVDWRAVLVRYMEHVIASEGEHFVGYMSETDQDYSVLVDVLREVRPNMVPRKSVKEQ